MEETAVDMEHEIVDGGGRFLPPREVEEILARGPRIMTGY